MALQQLKADLCAVSSGRPSVGPLEQASGEVSSEEAGLASGSTAETVGTGGGGSGQHGADWDVLLTSAIAPLPEVHMEAAGASEADVADELTNLSETELVDLVANTATMVRDLQDSRRTLVEGSAEVEVESTLAEDGDGNGGPDADGCSYRGSAHSEDEVDCLSDGSSELSEEVWGEEG